MDRIPKKIHILKFIAEQGIVTIGDIQRNIGEADDFESIRVILYQLGIGHIKFGDIPHGVWFIKNQSSIEILKTYFKEFPNFPIRNVHLHLVPHALGMNKIRTILEQTSNIKVETWWSENYIRALSPAMRFGISLPKIPDAIFWRLRSDGSRQKFFLEYERTLKNKARYFELFQNYAKRSDSQSKSVIYICENDLIKTELERIEGLLVKSGRLEGCGLCFQFITFNEFCTQYKPVNQTRKENAVCVT